MINLYSEFPKESGIYCYENKINGKKYVGLAKNIIKRIKQHESNFEKDDFNKIKEKENIYLWNSIKRHGRENFYVFVVELCGEEYLCEREIYYIDILNSHITKNGYNILWGGNLAWKNVSRTSETKLKISKTKSDGRMIGENNPNFGNKGILSYWFGKYHTEETKKKQSEVKKGKPRSAETIEKLKENKGEKHWNFGNETNQETKDKMSKGMLGIKHSGATSKYKGVSFEKKFNRFKARITINRIYTYLGVFKTEIEAAQAYDEKCWEVYHDLSMLNFPENYK
jgi:group I intron endonuclease